VVIVSHDRYFLDKVATKTIILEEGTCTTFLGNYSFSLKEQERLLLLEFEQYKNQQKKIAAMQAAIKRYRDWADRSNNEKLYRKAKELEKRLEKMDQLERPEMEKAKIPLRFSGDRSSRDVLRMERADLTIGDKLLLQSITMQLYYRDKVCLMGANGSGKTTLLRAIMGELPCQGVFLAETAKIGFIPQEIRFTDEKATVLQVFREESPCTEGVARSILARYFFFADDVYKKVSMLSGGEKVLLKLAVLMQKEINLLILDEPTNHIDIDTREILENALLEYSGTLLFVSHDRFFIRKIAKRIFDIQDGSLISFDGDYEVYRVLRGRVNS
jgi:ATPase subunit of ABC transporter with duplicated ATPase domains